MRNREAIGSRLRRRVVAGLAVAGFGLLGAVPATDLDMVSVLPHTDKAEARSIIPLPRSMPTRQPGYQLVTDGGDVLPFGTAPVGSAPAPLPRGVAGVAWTADGNGHWLATRDGGVFTFGNAAFHGSVGDRALRSPITGIASTSSGNGYWLVAADGGVFAFGDATFHGSLAGKPSRGIVVGIAPTRSGKGYWLASSDGGVFTFGDAKYRGAATDQPLNEPIVGITPTRTGKGYWLASAEGGVFTFGDAKYRGGLSGETLNSPIVGMAVTRTGKGYWLAAADGGVFSFGDAPFLGSSGGGVWGKVVGIAGGAAHPKPAAKEQGKASGALRTRFGHDISWPQCDDPYPEAGYGYGIVGVTGGRPFRANRCLASQWQWALAHGSGAGVYVNLAAPLPGDPISMSGPAGSCSLEDLPCQFYNHSANNMLYAMDVARRAGVDAPMWWLDVEVLNHWDARKDLNTLVIRAATETLQKAGIRTGVYSTYLMWRRITGDAQLGLPIWAAGAPTDDVAPSWCDGRKAFNGGQMWLVQSLPITFDNNWACDPVASDPGAVFAFRD
ncbi:MAG TPA: hypothetical protein VFU93_14745 [Acidimicrobiales bacterium]|nr:hypothetical protein [Acidimicrobiales bacterium]